MNVTFFRILGVFLALSLTHGGAEAKPTYPEMADGESLFWTESGATQWLTSRGPLTDFAPVSLAVGYGHRIGLARLAWRIQWITDAYADGPVSFLHVDFLSVERLWFEGSVRPFTRLALGVGLDLAGDTVDLGSDGYFNEENGASAGLSLTLGTGLDLMLTDHVFMRFDIAGRMHGGAGKTGLSAAFNGGVGFAY